jgi:hypothetical protein
VAKLAFLICPVRGVNSDVTRSYMEKLEDDGWEVHWPPRDTDQTDDTGWHICQDNGIAISHADRVFVVWDGKSQGCLFDLGMAFAYHKPITVLSAPPPSEGKSFQNMMRHWEARA